MTVWEIVIMMVVATVCVTCCIGMAYGSIVNTIERYNIRKTKRTMEVYAKVMEEFPAAMRKCIDMVEEKEKKKNEKWQNEYAEKILRNLDKDE